MSLDIFRRLLCLSIMVLPCLAMHCHNLHITPIHHHLRHFRCFLCVPDSRIQDISKETVFFPPPVLCFFTAVAFSGQTGRSGNRHYRLHHEYCIHSVCCVYPSLDCISSVSCQYIYRQNPPLGLALNSSIFFHAAAALGNISAYPPIATGNIII